MSQLTNAVKEIEYLLRLRTRALGIKFCADADELNGVTSIKRPKHPACLCQFFGIARIAGKTIGCTVEDVAGGTPEAFGNCASIFGMAEPNGFIYSGQMMAGGGYATLEDARGEQLAIKRLPAGSCQAIILSPAAEDKIEPDVVAFYGTPGQIMQLMNGLQWSNYEPVSMRFVGESSCSDGFIECYLTGKPAGTIPCMGERQRGGCDDSEMLLCVPPAMVFSALEGIKAWNHVGTAYPVLPFGTQCDPSTPAAINVYAALEE